MTTDAFEDQEHPPMPPQDTERHEALAVRLTAVEGELAGIKQTIKVAATIIGLLAASAITGSSWLATTTLRNEERVASIREEIHEHEDEQGHDAMVERVAALESQQRADRVELSVKLDGIANALADIQNRLERR